MITKTNLKGEQLIKKYESCMLVPYLCPAGVPTIGWGNTVYSTGRKVSLKDKAISQVEADKLFRFILDLFEKDVRSLIKTDITQNQFNALVSFAYNVGTDIDADLIAEGLGDSTLLKKININSKDPSIKDEFLKWNKIKGKVSKGLTSRRKIEAELYFTP